LNLIYNAKNVLSAVTRGATSSSFRGGGNFHQLSFDGVIVLIQPWYNFFANGHRYVLFATFPKMRAC